MKMSGMLFESFIVACIEIIGCDSGKVKYSPLIGAGLLPMGYTGRPVPVGSSKSGTGHLMLWYLKAYFCGACQ